MKNRKKILGVLLGVLILGVGIGSAFPGTRNWINANILGGETNLNEGDKLVIPTTDELPLSPDLLDSFNLYNTIARSEDAIVEAYHDDIAGGDSQRHRVFAKEILSYIHRINKNYILLNKLPFDPNEKLARAGEVVAYLFPEEPNPMLYAKAVGIMHMDIESDYLLSRAEATHIITRVFFEQGKNADDTLQILKEAGLINDENLWKQTHHLGFHMVEFIRLVLDLREVIERKNIESNSAKYKNNLHSLPTETAVVLNTSTLEILANAFAQEANREAAVPEANPQVLAFVTKVFERDFGKTLTSDMITRIRTAYYRESRERTPLVYELPKIILAGSCNHRLDLKTIMGTVAVTSPAGTTVICGKVMVNIPGNSYIINGFSFPKVFGLEDASEAGLYRTKTAVRRDMQNTFIVSPYGEEKVKIVYRPEGVENMIGKKFSVGIADYRGDEQAVLIKEYSELGAVFNLLPRAFTGENVVLFRSEEKK